jgi:predicted DNA-binding transcriptional regulator AlpA
MTNKNETYVDEKTVAKVTGFSLSTLRNQRFERRGIPYSKIGRSVRYKYNDVLNYMESKKIETESDW